MMNERTHCEAIIIVGTRGVGRRCDLHHDLVHRLAIPLSFDRAGQMQGKSRTAMEGQWKRQMAWQMDAHAHGLRSAVCGLPCVPRTYVRTRKLGMRSIVDGGLL
ncbi:hypothetical protein J3458_014372 [Metarhizium acridum]|uniref:uncharacterized protein n=1 Tax=Metarhizium acridum TaxID=92637 RepID=UPI001C6CAD96|nr:hypothetical protein J3458_014372 [Metarhizium acridum]